MNFWYQHRCSYPRTSLVEMRLKICSKEKRLSLVHLSLSLLDVIQRWWVSLLDIKHKWWLSPSLLYQLMQGWSTSANQRNQIAQMTWRPLFGWAKLQAHRRLKVTPAKAEEGVQKLILWLSWIPEKSQEIQISTISQCFRYEEAGCIRPSRFSWRQERNPFTEAAERRPSQRLLSRELPPHCAANQSLRQMPPRGPLGLYSRPVLIQVQIQTQIQIQRHKIAHLVLAKICG